MTTISADQASLRGTASCAEARIVGAGIPVLSLAIFLDVIGGFVAMGIIRFSRRNCSVGRICAVSCLLDEDIASPQVLAMQQLDSYYEFVDKRHGAMLLKQVIDLAGKKG
jgi:hypothetical protein